MSTRIRTRVAASSTGPAGRVSGEGGSNPQLRGGLQIDRISPKGGYLVKLRLHPNPGLIPASCRRWDFTPIVPAVGYPSEGGLAQWRDLGLGTEDLAPRQIIIYAITGLCAHRTARALISPPTLNQYRSILGAVGSADAEGRVRVPREIVDYHPVRANSPNSIQRHEVGIESAGSRIER